MLEIYLIRHGHVDYGPAMEITEHNPLTPLGCEMAERVAERCATWDLQYLFASTMLRAKQTADAISHRIPNLPRMDLPEFEEASLKDLARFTGEAAPEDMSRWSNAHFRFANSVLWVRARAGFQEMLNIAEREHLERIAVVAHGGTLNVLVRQFLGQSQATRLRDCWIEFDWTSVSSLRLSPDAAWMKRSIRWLNDARHVDDLRRQLATEGNENTLIDPAE